MPKENLVLNQIQNQIAEARKIQKERVDCLTEMKARYGDGKYEKLIEGIGNIDTFEQAKLAQAVGWDLTILIAFSQFSDSRESEIMEILGVSPDVAEKCVYKLHETAKKKFPFIVPANREQFG